MGGGNRKNTSAVIDSVLNLMVGTGVLAAAVTAPNLIKAFDSPLKLYYKKMDQRSRDREAARIIRYMQRKGLITKSYEHGLEISKNGINRINSKNLTIITPLSWDKKWRIIFYDIPENHKNNREKFTRTLKKLGLQQLQKSVWIHPFPYRKEIEAIAVNYNVHKYITYIETSHITNDHKLIKRFSTLIPCN